MRKQQQPAIAEPEKFDRWTAQRQAAIILEFLKGQISFRKPPQVWIHPRRVSQVGQSEPTSFDAAGNLVTHVDFNGRNKSFLYDTMPALEENA